MPMIRFDLTYFAGGRQHVRRVHMNIPEPQTIATRLEMRVDNMLFLSIPFGENYEAVEDEDD